MTIEPLSIFKEKVNAELKRQFSEYKKNLVGADSIYLDLLDEMETFILRGGKRLRPYMMYLAYKGFGGMQDESILPVTASLELLHNFLLIHDDIIDQDTMRYGGKNIGGVYKDYFAELGDDEAKRNANNVALLAGDISHLMSSRVIVGSDFSTDIKNRILGLNHEIALKVSEGELVDSVLSLGIKNVDTSEKRIIMMYENKTATYSFELPLCLGLVLATGSEDKVKLAMIKKLSSSLGIAYQLQDDLLGVFGNSQATGKTDDGDIRQGKRTLMHAKAIATLKGNDLEIFSMLYGKKDASKDEIESVRDILESHSIRKYIEDLCNQYGATSLLLIKEIGLEPEALKTFETLIESFKCRTQ
jgi:geranylgeranyl diphosphate synthase type II